MQENFQYDASIVPQEIEALCGDTRLTPEIRLQALELQQVQRRLTVLIFKFLLSL
jgi:hypothetical protein